MPDQIQSSDGNVYESDTHALVGQAEAGLSSRTWANTQPTVDAMKAPTEFLRPPGTVMPVGDVISTSLNLIGMRTGSPRVPDPTNTKAFLEYTARTRQTLENLKGMPEKYRFNAQQVESPSLFQDGLLSSQQMGIEAGQHKIIFSDAVIPGEFANTKVSGAGAIDEAGKWTSNAGFKSVTMENKAYQSANENVPVSERDLYESSVNANNARKEFKVIEQKQMEQTNEGYSLFPKGYLDKVPQEQRLSRNGITHPGFRWEIIDKQTGERQGQLLTNSIRARQRVDQLDNRYGGYRYQKRVVPAGKQITEAEASFMQQFEQSGPNQMK